MVSLAALSALIVSPHEVAAATQVAGLISENTVWEPVGNPYVMTDDITVEKGVTLTLLPDVIVKAHSGAELVVLGHLAARGKRTAPIVLTSYADDTVGGDTNGDASETQAMQGDWVGIGFFGDRTGSVLEFLDIRYAGYYGPTGSNFNEGRNDDSDEPTPLDARVQTACGSCHLLPPPDILPKEMWPVEISRMAQMKHDMSSEFAIPVFAFSKREVSEWYERLTPETFQLKVELTRSGPGPLQFRRRGIRLGPEGSAHVATVVRLDAGKFGADEPLIAAVNMKNGSIHFVSFTSAARLIGKAGHPARVVAADINGDGAEDLIISDLGDLIPTDDPVGRVIVALNRGEGKFEFRTIIEGLPRVADARAVDLDGDGDLDIAVAAFGHRKTGGVYLLRNESKTADQLHFVLEQVVARSGAVSLIPVDGLQPGLGRGLVVAFAQQHELVSVFYPEASADKEKPAGYREQVLYRAPHPNWGISNLEAADIDGDGDLDFLLAHGDTMDDGFAYKPYHGVDWLENRGEAGFQHHRVGDLYGAHRAEAVDLDGDGDLDVVATGFLLQVPVSGPASKGTIRVDSVVWFEQTGDRWIPWSIESNHPRHTGMTVIDVNRDGRPDIVAAVNFSWDDEQPAAAPALEVWINRKPQRPPSPR